MCEILKLEDVSYEYVGKNGGVKAVKRANGIFESGKLYAITGKSGSGKTTLLSLIAGLDKVKEGDIIFKGESLKKIDRDIYRSTSIGIVFQQFNLLTQLTAFENVILSLDLCKFKGNKKERAMELLYKVGIDEVKANRRVLKLSGGEQQRVGIARALAPNPYLILADEPTGNLDSENGDNIIKILLKLAHEEGKCVIMITHSNSLAKLSDEIWGMRDGILMPLKA